MCKIKRCLFTGMLMTFLLVACQPLIIPATPTTESIEPSTTPTSTTPVTATTTLSESVPAVETGVLTGTETSLITTSSATVTASETITTAVAVTATPTTTASTETSAVGTEPTLTVLVASLRIRSGPGPAYDILGAATQGEQFSIVGQATDCQWYQVAHPQLGEVWLAGGAQYVATDVSCAQVAGGFIPTPQPTAVVPTQTQQTDAPPPTQAVTDPFPADQGCLILQNQLGPELTFTFTSADNSWNDSIKVSAGHDIPYCFKPGNYRVTVDAPPPWPSLNLDFAIQAGYRAYFPIRPQ